MYEHEVNFFLWSKQSRMIGGDDVLPHLICLFKHRKSLFKESNLLALSAQTATLNHNSFNFLLKSIISLVSIILSSHYNSTYHGGRCNTDSYPAELYFFLFWFEGTNNPSFQYSTFSFLWASWITYIKRNQMFRVYVNWYGTQHWR